MASFSCKVSAVTRSRRSTICARSRRRRPPRPSRADLVVGSGAEALVAARGHGRWSTRLPRAADARLLPAGAAQPSRPADLRPRARREADDMSRPDVSLVEGDARRSRRGHAGDGRQLRPALRRGLDRAAMRRAAADAGRLADAGPRRGRGDRLRARPAGRRTRRSCCCSRCAAAAQRRGIGKLLLERFTVRRARCAAQSVFISKSAKEIMQLSYTRMTASL